MPQCQVVLAGGGLLVLLPVCNLFFFYILLQLCYGILLISPHLLTKLVYSLQPLDGISFSFSWWTFRKILFTLRSKPLPARCLPCGRLIFIPFQTRGRSNKWCVPLYLTTHIFHVLEPLRHQKGPLKLEFQVGNSEALLQSNVAASSFEWKRCIVLISSYVVCLCH